jgi:hypothetical protein
LYLLQTMANLWYGWLMGLGVSDWLAIFVFGAGALVGTFGKSVIRAAGIAVMTIALGGLYFGHRLEAQGQAQTPKTPAIINSPCSFPGGSNSGSVNCGNTYNGVQAPQLQYQRIETHQAGGDYVTNIFFNLVSPFSPSQLAFEVHAPDIKANLQIIPALQGGVGIVMTGNTGMRPGYAFSSIQNPPPGQIVVRLITATNPGQNIKIYYSF